ncbi:UDP-glucuronosyl/UDP-glucosyltransferase [Streptomyces toyocaensis]|uniref:UDP-glucuronosyl/UDP-glucosyltransferase n=1 Tax=Streptomyces toyocaensis TaxID=55952 RepID=A0A081XYW7_STRTO|nr:glycosyltransferase [Streptomyces toyocaensis]KES08740.1 UDP-glucuronosyl/UDP-glucosyltransferase [Streptomyces toyocaensis]
MPRILIVSPPFHSHATPLSVLAAALAAHGAEVFFACAPAFRPLADRAGVGFVPLTVTRNSNTGVAERTDQAAREAARLAEFLRATRRGPVDTLLTQARHRRADMLADPEGVYEDLRSVDRRLRPDWYVVDQLAYAATLALHCLGVPYASYCPGHPGYVLSGPGSFFGLPHDWPEAVRPAPSPLATLRAAVRDNDRAFTGLFAAFARDRAPSAPAPGRAFALTSPHAVLYAYPDLPWLPGRPEGPVHLFAGHMAGPDEPPAPDWTRRLRELRERAERLVLVAFGTFLSARDDVLRRVVSGLLDGTDDTAVVVAAGARAGALADLAGDRAVVVPTVSQRQLLPHVDAMVHHGGGNSFTECLRAGVPALVLPMSSDQFSIARDAERAGVGVVRDPNALRPPDVPEALAAATADTVRGRAARMARDLRRYGPAWAAEHLVGAMEARLPLPR